MWNIYYKNVRIANCKIQDNPYLRSSLPHEKVIIIFSKIYDAAAEEN